MTDDIRWIRDNPTPTDVTALLTALPDCAGEAPPAVEGRALTQEEIDALRNGGNACRDWAQIRVGPSFAVEGIHGCLFSGPCFLDVGREGALSNAVVTASTIGPGCLVQNATLRGAVLAAGAVVLQSSVGAAPGEATGSVAVDGSPTPAPRGAAPGRFGIGMTVEPGVETGGRRLRLHPDLTFPLAAELAAQGGDAEPPDYAQLIEALLAVAPSVDVFVGAGALVESCGIVLSALIGPGACLRAASLVENATILSSPEQRSACESGAVVRDAILQEGAVVETGASVSRSMLFETARAERHAKITGSLIAPNTEIAEGEVTASLVGPFVGMHHQSLLIAAMWPEGRGNIGYGANVGSNHTSRSADQEIRPGEGTFFGLGTSIKFPANYDDAPYTVIATGTTTLPQRVAMPFSLITAALVDTGGLYTPGINQILPAWGLYANAYALFRNERKYASRDRARRHGPVRSVITPALADALDRAAARLEEALAGAAEPGLPSFFDQRSIPELGKNFATVEDCRRGAETYRRYARFFRLYLRIHGAGGLAAPVAAGDAGGPGSVSPTDRQEFAGLLEDVYADAERSRRKDIERGRRIIDDYEAVRPTLEEDGVLALLRSLREDGE